MKTSICIIGAMKSEVTYLKGIQKKFKNLKITVSECGIGKVNAAANTQHLIDQYKPNLIINTGIAGALDPSLGVMDVVLATDTVQHDVDARPFIKDVMKVPGEERWNYPTILIDPKLGDLLDDYLGSMDIITPTRIVYGRIASGDQFIHTSRARTKINKAANARCCDMESAAIGQVCFKNKINFFCIRSISDSADEEAGSKCKFNETLAAEHSADMVESLLEEINSSKLLRKYLK